MFDSSKSLVWAKSGEEYTAKGTNPGIVRTDGLTSYRIVPHGAHFDLFTTADGDDEQQQTGLFSDHFSSLEAAQHYANFWENC